ncbi:hypothetical protein J3A65_000328 [Rhizobium sp. PvP014]|nr:hypothetical protein [Rhizobium sp. PvP099]MBP2459578.1 hypothetical protein [Rhizobium sp. PvP014]
MPQIDWRHEQRAAEAMAKAAKTDADEAKSIAQATDKTIKSAAIVFEKYLSITKGPQLSVLAAPQVASFQIPEVKFNDIVFVHRAGRATNGPPTAPVVVVGGISLESTGYVPADGVVEVYYSIPTIVIALGASLIIPLRLRGFRAS